MGMVANENLELNYLERFSTTKEGYKICGVAL